MWRDRAKERNETRKVRKKTLAFAAAIRERKDGLPWRSNKRMRRIRKKGRKMLLFKIGA